MIRYVQFHDPSPQLSEVLGFGPYHQTLANGLGARGHRIFSTLYFDQAHSARSESFKRVGGAKFGNGNIRFKRGAQNGVARSGLDLLTIDHQTDAFAPALWRA